MLLGTWSSKGSTGTGGLISKAAHSQLLAGGSGSTTCSSARRLGRPHTCRRLPLSKRSTKIRANCNFFCHLVWEVTRHYVHTSILVAQVTSFQCGREPVGFTRKQESEGPRRRRGLRNGNLRPKPTPTDSDTPGVGPAAGFLMSLPSGSDAPQSLAPMAEVYGAASATGCLAGPLSGHGRALPQAHGDARDGSPAQQLGPASA